MKENNNNFHLTRDKAKEYFFLNDCNLKKMKIDSEDNYNLFKSFLFSDREIKEWTNEYVFMVIHDKEWSKDNLDLIFRVIEHGNMLDKDNIIFLFDAYERLNHKFTIKDKLDILVNSFLDNDNYIGLVDILMKTSFYFYKEEAIVYLEDLKKKIELDDRYKKDILIQIDNKILEIKEVL